MANERFLGEQYADRDFVRDMRSGAIADYKKKPMEKAGGGRFHRGPAILSGDRANHDG